ncbi:MAG: aromatic ring-hydroxylating dioxygenase subunit alpha [Burkholderiales bacterium]
MYLRNAWYVAAWDQEVTGERPFGRILLGEPVVLYRMKSGEVVALEDRCCHRRYPLHKATLHNDQLECAYHGFTYDCTGKCVHIPGQATIPESARVKRYQVVERHRWIWVWMGDPARADPAEIVDFHWLDDPLWRAKGTVFNVKASYELIIENLLDLTHLSFVHKSTIGNHATAEAAKTQTRRTANDVTVARWMIDTPPPATYVKAGGFRGNVDRWQFINFVPPAFIRLDVGALDTGQGAPQMKTGAFAAEGNLPGGIEMRNLNAITPESERTCHYFWAQAHNFLLDQPQVTDMLFEQIDTAFRQDWEVFETQQRWIDLDPAAARVDVNGDAGQIQSIRMLRERIAEEQRAGRRQVA